MEAYLEAQNIGVLRAATEGFPPPKDTKNLTDEETNHVTWNAKAKNTLFRGICKDVFNRVRNHKNAHDLWTEICALHEGTKSEREERYHLVMKKLNSFEMNANESANEMYSRLNVLVEELNGLGLTQMSPFDVVRRILCVLPIEKYGHIVTVLKVIFPPLLQLKSWERSMCMRCTFTSLHKMALPLRRRKIWHSRLAMTRRAKEKPW
jgi:hypothetical protein